jgi:hypothetical protein
MTIDRDKLRAIAHGARPTWTDGTETNIRSYLREESAAHAIAANPTAVLALLEALEAAERESAYRIDAETRAAKERDEARAEVERLRALLARILKYAREDRARTPGATRLARALDEADAALAGKDGAR